jgi:hypothetical protein
MRLQLPQDTPFSPIDKVGESQKNAPYKTVAQRENHAELSTELAPSVSPPRKPVVQVHFKKGILVDFYG